MRTISELQQEIRSMQTGLRDMDERLNRLSNELSDYKDSQKADSVYRRIYDIASSMPVIEHPINCSKCKGQYSYNGSGIWHRGRR